jgi:predicted DNA-binding protein (UPF0278 family)
MVYRDVIKEMMSFMKNAGCGKEFLDEISYSTTNFHVRQAENCYSSIIYDYLFYV